MIPWLYNPWGEDGKGPLEFHCHFKDKEYVWVEDDFDGKRLLMAHWESIENVKSIVPGRLIAQDVKHD